MPSSGQLTNMPQVSASFVIRGGRSSPQPQAARSAVSRYSRASRSRSGSRAYISMIRRRLLRIIEIYERLPDLDLLARLRAEERRVGMQGGYESGGAYYE